MRLSRSTLALLLIAAFPLGLSAQHRFDAGDWQLSCSRSRGGGGGDRWDERARFCNLIEKTLPLDEGALSIDGRMNGGISVIGENRRDILVRAMVEAHARTEARAESLGEAVELHAAGGRIYADGPETHGQEWWSVSFEVHVPSRSDLELKAHDGGIAVAEVSGRLRMETLNGGIHLESVNGDVEAETTNGGLHVELDGDRWEGKGLDAITTNGGVHLRLPSNYSAHLETGTTNGGVDIDFPVTVQGKIGRRLSTDLGRGGATIRVVTTNGGVTISKN